MRQVRVSHAKHLRGEYGVIELSRNYKKEILFLVGITALFVFLDQVTKYFIATYINPAEPIVLFKNFFQITYTMNPGAAFGFLADKSESLRLPLFIGITAFAVILIIYTYFSLGEEDSLVKLALSMILSGATGNLIDRIRLRAVVDFLNVHYYDMHWPAFNVADSMITIGVSLIFIDIIIKSYKMKGAK